ncbi:MAG: putative peptidoglycan glycosyltransferase FtsW [Patescibacteria group bacterium]
MKKKKLQNFDSLLLYSVLALLIFGVLVIYDVSVVLAHDVFGGKYYFLFLQIAWVAFGLLGLSLGYRTSFTVIKKLSLPLFIGSLISLIFVLLPSPFSPLIYGARRWVYLNPDPFPLIPFIGRLGFQPSEFVKLAFILYFSMFLVKKKEVSPAQFVLLVGLIVGFVMLQPDLGTALLISGTAMIMYFLSGAKLSYFMLGIPLGALLVFLLIFSSAYRRERLITYLGLKKSDPQGSSYHINQIMIALGSGGVFGLGFGESRQKYQYIPEVATDSIFAIIGEELGFFGVLVLISSFAFIIYRGFRIALLSDDAYQRLLGSGITSAFAIQCFVNLAAMVHLIPLTGVPLPLISYGGSSMVFGLSGIGILLNISRNNKRL